MERISGYAVRNVLLAALEIQFATRGEPSQTVADDVNLFAQGMIDSMGLLELIVAVEQHFGIQIDIEKIPPKKVSAIGPLSQYIEDVHGSSNANHGLGL